MPTYRSATLIADIHGVAVALDAMLEEESRAPSEVTLVAGDIAAGPQPNEAIDLLRHCGERVIAIGGNADRELVEIAHGKEPSIPDPIAAWAAGQLTSENLAWLTNLPASATVTLDGFGEVFLCHASPRNDEDILLVDTRIARWQEAFAPLPESVTTVVLGHTHMPFQRLVNRRRVINPGSIGMPYGAAGAHWCRLHDGVIETHVTHVEIETAIQAIAATSAYSQAAAWAREYLTSAASDLDAIAAFGPRDGR